MAETSTERTESTEALPTSFLEALYGDPLRAETMRTGRYLVIASSICISVVLFKVRLQSTSLIPLDFGDRVDVLPMLLSLAVLLLLLSFMMRATTDLLRDFEAGILVTRYIENERVKAADAAARAIDNEMGQAQYDDMEGPSDPDPWWESAINISEEAAKAVLKAEERVGIRRLPRQLRRLREWTEIGIPIAFAVVALFLSKASLGAFSVALISALKP